ncbi:MAG: hypothetical protein ACRC0L_09155 [Angustibacter sp.]
MSLNDPVVVVHDQVDARAAGMAENGVVVRAASSGLAGLALDGSQCASDELALAVDDFVSDGMSALEAIGARTELRGEDLNRISVGALEVSTTAAERLGRLRDRIGTGQPLPMS